MSIATILTVLEAVFGPVQLRGGCRRFRLTAGTREWLGTSMAAVVLRALAETQGAPCAKP